MINKDAGIPFHSAGLTEKLRHQLAVQAVYPVHRLDSMTSGVLLLALNKKSARELSLQLSNNEMRKNYVAIGANRPKKKQGMIRGDMQKRRNGAWILKKTAENPAVTRFFSRSFSPGLRVYLVKPQSGKTHQIRVALKAIGAPILGDTLYGKEPSDRGYLHSLSLRFHLGTQEYRFRALPRQGAFFTSRQFRDTLEAFGELEN